MRKWINLVDLNEAPIRLRGFSPEANPDAEKISEKLNAFLAAMDELSRPNPLDQRARVFDGAVVVFKKFGSSISIQDIRSTDRGGGSKTLQMICEKADELGVTLTLYAKGYAHVPTDKLVQFYTRFGFHVIDDQGEGVDMERKPIMRLKLSGDMMTIPMSEGMFGSDDDCWFRADGSQAFLDRNTGMTHGDLAAATFHVPNIDALQHAFQEGWIRMWKHMSSLCVEFDFKTVSRKALMNAIRYIRKIHDVDVMYIDDIATHNHENFPDMRSAERRLNQLLNGRTISSLFD